MTIKTPNTFIEFAKNNAWGIATLLMVGATNYGILTTRLEALEKKVAEHEEQLAALATVRTMSYQIEIMQDELREIKTKIVSYDTNIQMFYKNEWVKVERILERIELEKQLKSNNRNLGVRHGD